MPATAAHEYENAPLPGGVETAPRLPNWDYGTAHHHWLVSDKEPLSPALVQFSDQLFARRLRATMSVDDIVAAVLGLLQARGALDDTCVVVHGAAAVPAAVAEVPRPSPASAAATSSSRPTTATTSASSACPRVSAQSNPAASHTGIAPLSPSLPTGKFNAYENDIRVPFFVRGPGVPAGAARDDVMVNNVDIGATILDLGE